MKVWQWMENSSPFYVISFYVLFTVMSLYFFTVVVMLCYVMLLCFWCVASPMSCSESIGSFPVKFPPSLMETRLLTPCDPYWTQGWTLASCSSPTIGFNHSDIIHWFVDSVLKLQVCICSVAILGFWSHKWPYLYASMELTLLAASLVSYFSKHHCLSTFTLLSLKGNCS